MARPVVFVAEEFPRDIELTMLALAELGIDHSLAVARDGAEALCWFEAAATDANPVAVSIVFLGMKLPLLSGLDVLRRMRAIPAFTATPVVLFSSAPDHQAFGEARALGAHATIPRPDDFRALVSLLHKVVPRDLLGAD